MYNLILVCEHGASTGMLTERMKDAAKAKNIEVQINAYPYSKLSEVIDGADAVLLGPQVRFKKKQFEEEYASKNVPFIVINTMDYGMMNGEKVLEAVINELEK